MEIEEGDNTLRDLHNSSYDTKAEFSQVADGFELSSCFLADLPFFLPCLFLSLETSEMSTILFSKPKQLNLVPRSSRLTVH